MLVSDIETLSIINNVRWIYILVQHDITKAVFSIVSNAAYLYVQTLQVRYTADIDGSYMFTRKYSPKHSAAFVNY